MFWGRGAARCGARAVPRITFKILKACEVSLPASIVTRFEMQIMMAMLGQL